MDTATASSSKAEGLSHGQVSEMQLSGEFAIKSEAVTPKLGEFGWKSPSKDGQVISRKEGGS